MIVNENSRKEIIIVQRLSNGERFKMKFEAGTTKSWAKSEFKRAFEAKNLKIRG